MTADNYRDATRRAHLNEHLRAKLDQAVDEIARKHGVSRREVMENAIKLLRERS